MKRKQQIKLPKKKGFPWDNMKPYVPEPKPKRNIKAEREKHQAFFKNHKKLFKKVVDERRFRISELHWEVEKTYREIGELFNISTSRANQISAHAMYLVEQKLLENND